MYECNKIRDTQIRSAAFSEEDTTKQTSRQSQQTDTTQARVKYLWRKNVCSLSKTVLIKAAQAKNCPEFIEHRAKRGEGKASKRRLEAPTQTHIHPNVAVELTVKSMQQFQIFSSTTLPFFFPTHSNTYRSTQAHFNSPTHMSVSLRAAVVVV